MTNSEYQKTQNSRHFCSPVVLLSV